MMVRDTVGEEETDWERDIIGDKGKVTRGATWLGRGYHQDSRGGETMDRERLVRDTDHGWGGDIMDEDNKPWMGLRHCKRGEEEATGVRTPWVWRGPSWVGENRGWRGDTMSGEGTPQWGTWYG